MLAWARNKTHGITNPINEEHVEQYWQSYLATGLNDFYKHGNYEAHQFGDSAALADELGNLILKGVKVATCSTVWEWEAEGSELPKIGSKTIVLDGNNCPLYMIETTEVILRAFNEVDAQFAYEEGEYDRSLESWREEHWRYFLRVLPQIGKQPTPQMLLVCERFRVVYS